MRYLPLLLLVACADPFAPVGAVPFDPPAEYAGQWLDVERCSGLQRDLSGIHWYAVGDSSTAFFTAPDGRMAHGWYESPDRIYLAGWHAFMATDLFTVRHEMLHALLRGDGDHRSPLWDACGLVILV